MQAAEKLTDNGPESILEDAYLGRLNHLDTGHYEVPTQLFTGRVDLKMAPIPDIELYVYGSKGIELLKRADQGFSPLALSNYEAVLIKDQDLGEIQNYAESQMLSAGGNSLKPEQRMSALRKVAISTVEDLFEDPSPSNVRRSQRVVGSFVYLLMREPRSFYVLTRLSSHDPYTLQHSVGTAVNAVILARKAGVTDDVLLQEAGMGGLLHDIGKIKVDTDIINKKGPLDKGEWDVMRQHSSYGFEILQKVPELSDRVKLAVLEHHEDREGTGYPNRLDWNEIGSLSKIVGISDIFNALTTDRSYSKARSPFDALDLMNQQLKHKIDVELYKFLVLIYGGKIEDLE